MQPLLHVRTPLGHMWHLADTGPRPVDNTMPRTYCGLPYLAGTDLVQLARDRDSDGECSNCLANEERRRARTVTALG